MVWSTFPSLLGSPSRRSQWDPWREMGRLHEEMARLFGDAPRAVSGSRASFPPVQIFTDEEGARMIALVPGLAAGDVNVVIEGDILKLEGARRAAEPTQGGSPSQGGTYLRQERGTGEFARSFRLPFEVDSSSVSARLENGVLEVVLPRTPEQRPRKIEVRSS